MDKTRKLITEINHMLDGRQRTVESCVFPENAPGYDGNMGMDFDLEYDDEMPEQQGPQNSGIVNIINNIRQMALNGISQLANTPQDPQYDLLKKIWQLVDKTVEVKDDKNKKQ